MAVIDTILEYSSPAISSGVIMGVKIAGLQSENGRLYPWATLQQSQHLYENAPVYMLHGTPAEKMHGSRKHDEHFGSLKNVHMRADGLWGDLHVKQSHPQAQFVLESDGRKFGLSHNVRAEMTDDHKTVTEIVSVNSVDLVDNPATTKNLFEGDKDMELKELVAAQKASDEVTAKLVEGQAKLVTALESLQAAVNNAKETETPPGKQTRVTALEQVTSVREGEESTPIGNTHDDFLAAVRGFSVVNTGGPQA